VYAGGVSTQRAGCADDPTEGRESGPSHPDGFALFRRDLTAMRDWLGRDWLCGSGDHPVRTLWQRSDDGASLELQSVAGAIHCIAPKATGALKRQWLDGIRSDNPRTSRTTFFEVYAAGLFAHSSPVQTVGAKQPGYDFAIEFEAAGTARVSCKSREPSDDEVKAALFTSRLRDRVRERIIPGDAVSIHLFSPKPAPAWLCNDVDRIMPRVRDAVRRARREGQSVETSVDNDWRIEVDLIAPNYQPLVFREDKLSFNVVVGVTLDYERLVANFRSKVVDAIRNVTDHSDANEKLTNVIVYRIPQHLAVDDAVASIREVFASTASERVACMFLYRAGFYTTDPKRARFYLGHEWWEVKNERATTPLANVLPGGKLAFEVFGGKHQSVEPVQMVTQGDKQYPLAPGFWLRTHGEHHYRMPNWSGRGPAVVRPHGLAITFSCWHVVANAVSERRLTEEIPSDPTLL
jgi:hypothetical protein